MLRNLLLSLLLPNNPQPQRQFTNQDRNKRRDQRMQKEQLDREEMGTMRVTRVRKS